MAYTAITRARVKVVIYDQDEVKRRPLYHYLLRKKLAKVFNSKDISAKGLAVSSTPEEWQRQANNLLRQKLFQIAALCFKKANDVRGMLGALAMHYYQASEGPPDRLLRAARAFEMAGHTNHAASCLKRAGEFTLAATAYRKLGKRSTIARMLGAAAEKASSRREATELYSAAAVAWEEAGRLTQAMLIRLSHKELQQEGLDMLQVRDHNLHSISARFT